jgi:hypothetical protein
MSDESQQTNIDAAVSTPKRLRKWLMSLGLVVLGLGYLLLTEHPPYPSTFNIEWDEEVQVSASQTSWIHHTELYQRRSIWSRWDARKISEALAFEPDDRKESLSYRLKRGVFRGIEKVGQDWIIEYAEDIHYPSIGSCVPGEGTECYVVIKSDGAIYKPKNRKEIFDNFGWLVSCRTTVSSCFSRFNGHRVSLPEKQNYIRENPRFGDGDSPTRGQQLKEQEMR